jgi:hypothetical protein
MANLSFVGLAAYDYQDLIRSIGFYYAIADEIIIGLDADRVSWSGHRFEFDDGEFRRRLAAADPDGKIRVVEDNFHQFDLPARNDTHERNVLSTHCADGNWIVQIDADEYLINPGEFKAFLDQAPPDALVHANWITVFKTFGAKYLVIDTGRRFDATPPVAIRRKRAYVSCREVGYSGIASPGVLLHMSYGRTRDGLQQKLRHWTHSGDFDTVKYLELWDSITLDNYREVRDFHPLGLSDWKGLKLIEGGAR